MFDRASGSAVDLAITALIEAIGTIAVTQPVVMEILAGARTDQRAADRRRLLRRFELLWFDVDLERVARVVGIDLDDASSPRGISVPQQRVRDDLPLDLRGALEDGGQPGVAPVALDRVLSGVAVAAEDLQRLAGHPLGGLAGHQLGR